MIHTSYWNIRRAMAVLVTVLVALAIAEGARLWQGEQVKAATSPITVRTLVLLINFTDTKATPLSKAGAEALYFGPTNSVASYYKAISLGNLNIIGDVTGWYSVNRAGYADCSTGYKVWRTEALNLARAAGVVPENYQYIHYMFTGTPCNTPGWGTYPSSFPASNFALGPGNPPITVGGAETYMWGYFYVAASTHEFGHNFLNGHSDTYTNPTGYGDISDVMGNFWQVAGYAPMMFNAPHLINRGWLDPIGIKTVTSSGTYTINSLESNTGLRVLQIPVFNAAPSTHFFSVREATGIDANMPAYYRTGANVTYWGYQPVVDTRLEKVLTDGASFTDSANGITVKQLSHTANTATIDVTIAATGCTHYKPTVTTIPASGYPPSFVAVPGSSATFKVVVRNNDTGACPASNFTIIPSSPYGSLPAGWTAVINPPSLSILPAESASADFTITPSPTTKVPTTFSLNYSVSDGTTSYSYVMYVLVQSSSCTRATPTFTPLTTSATAPAGTAVPYKFTLKNNDNSNCTSGTFILSPELLPLGWIVITPAPTVVSPGSTVTLTATTTSPTTAPNGTTTIQIKAVDSSSAIHTVTKTIDYGVTAAACVSAAPTLTPTPLEYNNASAGASKSYSLAVTNNDSVGCAPSTFMLTPPSLPLGWTAGAPAPAVINAGAAQTILETITSSASAPAGTTTVLLQVSDTANPVHASSTAVKYGIVPLCTRAAPTLALTPTPQINLAGTPLSYTFQLTNRDSAACGPSTFTLSPSVPGGWSATLSQLSFSVSPGSFQQAVLSVTSASGAADGNYSVSVNTSNSSVPAHTGLISATYTVGVPPPPPPPLISDMGISATRVHSGGVSTLTWWVASGLGTGVSCSVTPASQIQSGVPTVVVGSGTVTSWGSSASPITAQTTPITGTVTFTLTCSNSAGASSSKSANAAPLPTYQDI